MTPPADGAAQLVAAAAVVALVAGAVATRRLLAGLPLALDFLLAAGLLRLTGGRGFAELAAAAAIIAIRAVVGRALRAGAPTLSAPDRPQEQR